MKSERLAYVALALASLFWAGNFVAGRALRDDIDPLALNAARWCIALVVMLPFVAASLWRARRVVAHTWPLLLGLSLTGVVAFQSMVYAGLLSTTAINGLLIVALVPVGVLVLSLLIGDTRPTAVQWLGAAISIVGVAVTVTRGSLDVLLGLRFNAGDLWILAAVVVWSVYSLLLRRRPAELTQEVMLAAIIAIGLVFLVPAAAVTTPFPVFDLAPTAWAAVLYIALFPGLLAFRLWSHGVEVIGPERSGYFVQLMPVFGAALAVLILGETLALPQLIGAALVLGGIVMVNREPKAG